MVSLDKKENFYFYKNKFSTKVGFGLIFVLISRYSLFELYKVGKLVESII